MTSLKSRGFYYKVYSFLPLIVLLTSVLNEFDFNYLNLDWDKCCLKANNKSMIIKTASNIKVRKEITKHDLRDNPDYLKILNDLGFKNKWLTQSIKN